MFITKRIAVAGLTLAVFAGCSGGSGVTPPAKLATTAPVAPASQKVAVAFVIAIPGRTAASAARRTPKYVGAGTMSAALTITPAGGSTPASSRTVNCTSTCSVATSLVPGTYTFGVTLYNGQNGTGAIISSGSASKTIVAGTDNTVNLSFTGSVAKANVTIAGPNDGPLVNGTPSTARISIEALDADGNTIVGQYDKTVTLTSSDGTNAPLNVPAPSATQAPGFDSSPPPAPAAQGNAGSVSITRSDQQPALAWSGNGNSLYSVVITAQVMGASTTTSASITVQGGATAPPAINPGDPETTPNPARPVGATPTPSAAPTLAPSGPSTPTAAPAPTTGTAVPLAMLTPQGYTLYGFVGNTAKTVSLGLGSQVNAEADSRPVALSQMNFNLSVNAGGLTTFGLKFPQHIDLQQRRVSGHGAPYIDEHDPSPLEKMHALGKGVAVPSRHAFTNRRSDGFSGMPAVGATSNWFVGTSTQAVTLRSIINASGTNNPRFLIWTANSSMVPDSIVPTFTQDMQYADTAITTAIGDFHYAANAPGIMQYATCDASGNADGGQAAGVVADPGYVNLVFYDGTVPGSTAGALGYFASSEYSPQSTTNCYKGNSDASPTIFVKYDPGTMLSTKQLNELQGTITHEYSHLVTYVAKSINQAGNYEYSWVLEGLGTYVQDYTSPPAVAGMTGPLGAPTSPNYDVQESLNLLPTYFASPQSYTLTGFAGLENGKYNAGGATNYGLSYLFLKYLTDRYGNGVIKSLHTTTLRGEANVAYAVNQNGGNGITFSQLFSDFVTMLAVSDTGITTDKRYNMQSFKIRNGNYAAQCSGCSSVMLTGPATAATLAAGQTAVVQNMFPGGFAFFNMNEVNPNGNVIRIDDTNSGALQLFGALGQM